MELVPISFVDADITTDQTSLVNDALTLLNTLLEAAGLPGWNQADADLLVIFLNTVAQIGADVNTTAATVLPAIFRAYGTQLLGIPYNNGTNAVVSSTWTFTEPAPDDVSYTIGAGTAVIVSGQVFYVVADTPVTEGSISAAVLLQAADVGSAYNGLGGIGDGYPDVQLNNSIDWVSTVETNAETSGGTDQETDEVYQDRLSSELQLQAPRPITAANFAQFVASDIAEQATGVAVGRSTSVDGYYPAARTLSTGGTGPTALTCTGSLTSGSKTVTMSTPPYPYAIPYPGATVTGTGIPGGATVAASPAPTTTGFTLSANASASESNETITVSAWQAVERCETTFVTDADGNALTNAQMDALQAWLATYREVSFLNFVEPPSYNTIYVSAEIHVYPAYLGQETAVCATVQATLLSYLNPMTWGNVASQGNVNSWLNATAGFNILRYTSLYGIIEQCAGVQYVVNGTLFTGFSASPSGTSDLTMTGPAPLPQATSSTIVISADT